jgi:hypothetical protein
MDLIEARKSKNYSSYGLKSNMIFCDEFNINEESFKREYMCMFEDNYDRPIIKKDINGSRFLLYKACGIPEKYITYSTEFVNKTKETYLNVIGDYSIPDLNFKSELNIHLFIDTNIYDGYKVNVCDGGIVMIILHEIRNEAPILIDYGNKNNVEDKENEE